jgi:hypothetical protein
MLHALGYWRPTLAASLDQAPPISASSMRKRSPRWTSSADKNLNYQGNPPGLVDARFIDALRTGCFQKKKAAALSLAESV